MLRHLENSTEVERNGAPDVVARELQELASVDVGHAAPLGDVPDALREEHAGGQRVGSRSHRETTIVPPRGNSCNNSAGQAISFART